LIYKFVCPSYIVENTECLSHHCQIRILSYPYHTTFLAPLFCHLIHFLWFNALHYHIPLIQFLFHHFFCHHIPLWSDSLLCNPLCVYYCSLCFIYTCFIRILSFIPKTRINIYFLYLFMIEIKHCNIINSHIFSSLYAWPFI